MSTKNHETRDITPVYASAQVFAKVADTLEKAITNLFAQDPSKLKEFEEGLAATTQLHQALEAALKTPHVLNDLLYITVYEHVQLYGGPEEGGWYYHNMIVRNVSCYYCPGDLTDPLDPGTSCHGLHHAMLEFAEAYFNAKFDYPAATAYLISSMRAGRAPHIYNLNQYGEGYSIAVERVPGVMADVARQHYE